MGKPRRSHAWQSQAGHQSVEGSTELVQLPQGLANFAAAFNLSGGCNRQPFWTWLVGFDVHSVSSKSKKPVMNGTF